MTPPRAPQTGVRTLLLIGTGMVVLGLALNAVLQPDSLGYGAARLVSVGGLTALLAALLQWARARSSGE